MLHNNNNNNNNNNSTHNTNDVSNNKTFMLHSTYPWFIVCAFPSCPGTHNVGICQGGCDGSVRDVIRHGWTGGLQEAVVATGVFEKG